MTALDLLQNSPLHEAIFRDSGVRFQPVAMGALRFLGQPAAHFDSEACLRIACTADASQCRSESFCSVALAMMWQCNSASCTALTPEALQLQPFVMHWLWTSLPGVSAFSWAARGQRTAER